MCPNPQGELKAELGVAQSSQVREPGDGQLCVPKASSPHVSIKARHLARPSRHACEMVPSCNAKAIQDI
jgi:hypothetical protein